jgi:hypothetical protein
LLETIRSVEKLTVAIALPEDDVDRHRNALECQSNSVPWCVKGGALIAGLTKAQ